MKKDNCCSSLSNRLKIDRHFFMKSFNENDPGGLARVISKLFSNLLTENMKGEEICK